MGSKMPVPAPEGPKPPASQAPPPAPLRSAMMGFRPPVVLEAMNRSYEVLKRHEEFTRLERLAARVTLPGFMIRVEEIGDRACIRVGFLDHYEGDRIYWSEPHFPKELCDTVGMALTVRKQAGHLMGNLIAKRIEIDGQPVFISGGEDA